MELLLGPAEPEGSLLERLPQLIEHIAAELPQLIEKEHAPVGQGQFPRPWATAAAQECRAGAAVVRAAEGPGADQSAQLLQFTCHRIELGDLQLLRWAEGRQQSGQALGQQGFAATGRADQQEVMAPGRGDLQGPPAVGLALDLLQVHRNRRGLGCVV